MHLCAVEPTARDAIALLAAPQHCTIVASRDNNIGSRATQS
jgi:hypothetical protein